MKKALCLTLVFTLFAAMALGSAENKSVVGKASATAAKDAKSTNSNSKTDKMAAESTAAKETQAEIQYVVSDTQFTYYKNSIGNTEYYGIVEITNTGSSYLYLDSCTFDLEDDDGHLLQSDDFISSCPDVIAPGEKGYFYNGLGSSTIDDGVSMKNGIKLVPQFKLEVAKKGAKSIVEYSVSDTSIKKGKYGGVSLVGRVENTTESNCSYLYVSVILYDKDGHVLSIFGTSVTDLDAGIKKSFECSGMFSNEKVTVDDVAEYKVIARDSYYQF